MSTLRNVSLYTLATLTTLVGCGSSQTDKHVSEEKNIQSEKKNDHHDLNKISQALGNFIGRNLNSPGIHFDLESIIKGIRDGAEGKPSPLSDQEYEKAMTQLQQEAVAAVSTKNLEAANEFLKENATAKDVVEVIPGKLQYLILEEGKDPAVAEHGAPQIFYTGKYLDGTVFGSSDTAADGPITVPLDETIPGFSKGIVGMKEGEKRRLFVHPDVGYGTSGQLLPNSLLIFDIEVVKAISPEKNTAEAFNRKANDLNDLPEEQEDAEFDEQESLQQEPKK